MTERNVSHGVFTVERTFPATPERVFAAFANEAAKRLWFGGGGGWDPVEESFDFRVGGREVAKGRWTETGVVSSFEAYYYDIIPNARLVYAYEMHLDDRKISVSLATVEIKPVAGGTQLKITEQGAFLDGYDDAGSREHGTNFLADLLGASLATPVD